MTKSADRPRILVLHGLSQETIDALGKLGEPVRLVGARSPEGIEANRIDGAVAVVTSAAIGFSQEWMDACPTVGLIHCIGAGYDGVDIDAARKRGIAVTSGGDANADCVADHAMAMLLAALRDIVRLDREVHEGVWKRASGLSQLSGKRVGIVGMGRIGLRIARRLQGFDVEVLYTARAPKPDLAWTYVSGVHELAARADHLVVICPATPATYHLIDRPVLAALGPGGVLVNVGRGSVVDTRALVESLENGEIAAAGLDVLEGEPKIPEALKTMSNVFLTPHIAAFSPEAFEAMSARAIANVAAHIAGRAPPNPVA